MSAWLEIFGGLPAAAWFWIAVWFVLAFCAIALSLSGLAALWRRRPFSATGRLGGGLILAGGVATTGALGLGMHAYDRLTDEQEALRVQFELAGERQYLATIVYPTGEEFSLELMGDEWQVDARILKWEGPAIVLGMDTLFRLERISGRYEDVTQERQALRTAHSLQARDVGIDPWRLANRYPDRLPWVDAIYGSATYLPMAHGAEYEVTVTASGLAARPANEAAEEAVRRW